MTIESVQVSNKLSQKSSSHETYASNVQPSPTTSTSTRTVSIATTTPLQQIVAALDKDKSRTKNIVNVSIANMVVKDTHGKSNKIILIGDTDKANAFVENISRTNTQDPSFVISSMDNKTGSKSSYLYLRMNFRSPFIAY